MRGNVIELAVAVVIGTAFNNVVTQFTKSFVEPLIRLISGGKAVSGAITLSGKGPDAVKMDIGGFINALLAFLITAAVVYYAIVKPYTVAKERFFPSPEPGTPDDVKLLQEIRDLLVAQNGGSTPTVTPPTP